MALIKCTECGKEFSDRAESCPNCGCPTEAVLEDIKKLGASHSAKEERKNEPEKGKHKEAEKKPDRKNILTEVQKMEYMLDAVQKTGVWSKDAGCNASKQLRQDLCFLTVFLGVVDNGFNKQRYDFINEVLRYNLDENDISSIVRNAEYENSKKFYNVMTEGIASVILDACDAEDMLRNRGMDSNICLPDKIATLFGVVGKAFLGDNCSRKERSAYAAYMMNINTFLSEEGYMKTRSKDVKAPEMRREEREANRKILDAIKAEKEFVMKIEKFEYVEKQSGTGYVLSGMIKKGGIYQKEGAYVVVSYQDGSTSMHQLISVSCNSQHKKYNYAKKGQFVKLFIQTEETTRFETAISVCDVIYDCNSPKFNKYQQDSKTVISKEEYAGESLSHQLHSSSVTQNENMEMKK